MCSRRKVGSRPGSVARALGVQIRASWQVITGSLSAESEPQDNGTPHFSIFSIVSHTVTSLALSFSPFTATDTTMRVSTTINTMRVWTLLVRVCVCAGLCICVLALGSPSFRMFACFFLCVEIDTYVIIFQSSNLYPNGAYISVILLYDYTPCCRCCIMSESHRPSNSQVLYYIAATVQQQAHIKLFLFVTVTSGAPVCVYAVFSADLSKIETNTQCQGRLLMGQDDT